MMREKVCEALIHRACPGGIPDEAALDDFALFGELVRQEVKGRVGTRAAAYLRRPDVARRWIVALRELRHDVEAQLSERGAGGDRIRRRDRGEEHERWRRSAVGFLGHVEARIEEARALLNDSGAVSSAEEAAGVDASFSTSVTDLLHLVRHYLVVESKLPEEARAAKRERLIEAVSGAISSSCSDSGRTSERSLV